jgi:VCBS repeat-containing protein
MATDFTPPTIAISSDKTVLRAGETALITFILSEPATDFVLSDVVVSGGTLSGLTGKGTTYFALFTPRSASLIPDVPFLELQRVDWGSLGRFPGSLSVGNFKFTDSAGNGNEDGKDQDNKISFTIDNVAPQIKVISASRLYLGLNVDPKIIFFLSEPSVNFDINDISVVGGQLSSFEGSHQQYSAILSPTSSGPVTITVKNDSFTDEIGNYNFGGMNSLTLHINNPNTLNINWNRLIGTSADDRVRALATGLDGSIYVAGITYGNLEGLTNQNTSPSSGFIINYTIDGSISSTRLVADEVNDIACGLDGSIYAVGVKTKDVFITKYEADGSEAWTRVLGNPGTDYAKGVATATDGSIYVAGFLGPEPTGFTDSNGPFIAKYYSDGTVDWTKFLDSNCHINAVAIGLDGSIYLTGGVLGDLDNRANPGGRSAFVSKFDSYGSKVWTRLLGSSSEDEATALTIGKDGSIYVSGYTGGDFDGQVRVNQGVDAFLTKFNPDGSKLWTRLLGVNYFTGWGRANALTTGLDGSIYVSGENSILDGVTIDGGGDPFLTKYTIDGNKSWTRFLGTKRNDGAFALTGGLDGSIYLAGYTYGDLDGQMHQGRGDIFVSKLVFEPILQNSNPIAAVVSGVTNEDTLLTSKLPEASDPDFNAITYAKASNPSNGTATVAAAGLYTYTPNKNYNGPDSFTYSVSDGLGGTNTYPVSLLIYSINDAPAAAAGNLSVTEDTAATGTLVATDADSTTLTYAVVSQPANGSVVVGANGAYSYTPAANFSGSDIFTFKANDGSADSNTATVTVTVAAVNDAPVVSAPLADRSVTVGSGLNFSFGLSAFTDVESTSLTYTAARANGSTLPTWLSFNAGTRTFSGTPALGDVGTVSLKVMASDGSLSASDIFDLVVNPRANASPTGTVTITGTPTQGQTLFAASTLADPDGIPTSGSGAIAYQWSADGVAINGATGSTLNLTQSLVGKALSVRASYTDNFGQAESVTSSATSVVANLNDAPTGAVSISGNASHRHSLSATNTLADVDGIPGSGAGAISYQWRANGSPISGATGSTFSPTPTQIGKVITVTASYTDLGGAVESITSPATEPIRGFRDFWHDAVTRGMERPNPQALPFGQDLLMADTNYSSDLARLFGVPLEFGS